MNAQLMRLGTLFPVLLLIVDLCTRSNLTAEYHVGAQPHRLYCNIQLIVIVVACYFYRVKITNTLHVKTVPFSYNISSQIQQIMISYASCSSYALIYTFRIPSNG